MTKRKILARKDNPDQRIELVRWHEGTLRGWFGFTASNDHKS